jgi:cell division protein FtsW
MGIGTFVKPASKPTNVQASRSRVFNGDLILVAIVIVLCVFGLLMVFSASTDFSLLKYGKPYFIFNKQILWMVLGTLVAVVVSQVDYHLVRKLAVPVMGVTVIALIAVLLVGESRLGSIRTFFGGSVQPSELAKLVTIIYLAVWLFSKRDHMDNVQLGLMPLGVILGIIGGLIFLQPDLSAAVTIFILGGLLFFLAGGDLKQFLIFIVAALVAGYLVIISSHTGAARIAAYTAGLKDPLQSSDHMLYSLESIVNGGFFGVGIGNAAIKVEGLPFAATDSIFAVIVEELGLLGVIGLVGLYGLLIWRGLKVAGRAPDFLGKVLAGGLTFWIGIEALINMAVMVGLMPFAGNALPFVSAGGSNLISMLTAVGLLVGISRQAGHKTPESDGEQRRSYSASADLRRGNRRRSVSRTRRS